MASPQFLELASHPGIILNVSQIVLIEKAELILSEQQRKVYKASDAMHVISISLVGGRNIELRFESEETCAATLKMIKIALKPFVVQEPTIATPEKPNSLITNRKSVS